MGEGGEVRERWRRGREKGEEGREGEKGRRKWSGGGKRGDRERGEGEG